MDTTRWLVLQCQRLIVLADGGSPSDPLENNKWINELFETPSSASPPSGANHASHMSDIWRAIVLGVIYFLCTQLSRLFGAGHFAPSLIWPADGIAIGLMLVSPASARWMMLGQR